MQLIMFMPLAPVAALASSKTDDPFVGKWTLDVARSTIVDQMRVEMAGPNTYRFSFEGAPAETIVANGSDQPGVQGSTLSVKPGGPRTLTVVRKQHGNIVVFAAWKLSADGRTLRDAFTSSQPGSPAMTVNYLYRRMSRTSGFAGVWESTTKPLGLKIQLTIQPYDEIGLTFATGGSEKKVAFDGRDHEVPGTTEGLSLSGRRLGKRVVEYSEKNRGKVERARQFALSPDGRTLTETLRIAGQRIPNLLVFARQ